MKRFEHVELRIGIEELKGLLALPAGCLIEALEPTEQYQRRSVMQMHASNVLGAAIPPRLGAPVEELRITFTADQETAPK